MDTYTLDLFGNYGILTNPEGSVVMRVTRPQVEQVTLTAVDVLPDWTEAYQAMQVLAAADHAPDDEVTEPPAEPAVIEPPEEEPS